MRLAAIGLAWALSTTESMLKLAGFVYVEGQVLLKLLNLCLGHLALLEVLLRLLLKRTIRRHQVVVELDQLLHFDQGVPRNVSLAVGIGHRVLALLSLLIADGESLVFPSEHRDSLLVLQLAAHFSLRERINLITLLIEVELNEVGQLVQAVRSLRLELLLRSQHLLE